MKTTTLSKGIYLILFLLLPLTVKSQVQSWWNNDPSSGNINNINTGDVIVTNSLKWANGTSTLSNDQGGSMELGYTHHHNCTPFIDFHIGGGSPEDYNMRIINSANYQLEFISGNLSNSAKMTYKGTPNGYYNLPSLRLTTTGDQGNSLQFQSANGLAAIDFWNFGGSNRGIMDFYADYNNPQYNQFSVKSDNTCGWGNDGSWLSAEQGGSIHLNKAGIGKSSTPFIDFSFGGGYYSQHIDARIKNSGSNTLDFWTNMDINGNGGNKIMSIKDNGVYAKKITVQTTWSDFVFNHNYHLIGLSELDNYIKVNGHLPDIPTEQSVTENGVELGDMTSKLLQKIEELSLYVIELNKQVELLKKDNVDMKILIKNK